MKKLLLALALTVAVAGRDACVGREARAADGFRSANFVVSAPTPALAREIGEAAEACRKQEALDWMGVEYPAWSHPCPITAAVSPQLGAAGRTEFIFDGGEVSDWKMQVQGSEDLILHSVIPHEVLHTVLASHFRRPLPRWADEGACTTVEQESELHKQRVMLVSDLQTGRGIPFSTLLEMKDYPADVMPLYSEGYSLADYLISQKGKPEFVRFLSDGLNSNWPQAVQTHYGPTSLQALQDQWMTSVMASVMKSNNIGILAAMHKTEPVELLEFSATWCGPCQQMKPTVTALAQAGYPIRTYDVDHDRVLAQKYSISSIPCVVILVDGHETGRLIGVQTKEQLLAALSHHANMEEAFTCDCGSCGTGSCGTGSGSTMNSSRPGTTTPTFNVPPAAPPYTPPSTPPLVTVPPVAPSPDLTALTNKVNSLEQQLTKLQLTPGPAGPPGPTGPVGAAGAAGVAGQVDPNTLKQTVQSVLAGTSLPVQLLGPGGEVRDSTRVPLDGQTALRLQSDVPTFSQPAD